MSYSGKHRNNKPQDSTSTWLTVEDLDKYLKSGKPYDGQIVSVTANRTAYLIAGAPGSFYKIPIGSRTYTASSSAQINQDPVYYRNPDEIPFINSTGDGWDYNSSFKMVGGTVLQIPYYIQAGTGNATGGSVLSFYHGRNGDSRYQFYNTNTHASAQATIHVGSDAQILAIRSFSSLHSGTRLGVSTASTAAIETTANPLFMQTLDASNMYFGTNDTLAMTIDGTTQHVGIGAAPDATYPLYVYNNLNGTTGIYTNNPTSGTLARSLLYVKAGNTYVTLTKNSPNYTQYSFLGLANNSNAAILYNSSNSGDFLMLNAGATNMYFGTGNTLAMTIDGSTQDVSIEQNLNIIDGEIDVQNSTSLPRINIGTSTEYQDGSGNLWQLNTSGYNVYRASSSMFFDLGGSFFVRDYDNSYQAVLSIDSATGNINAGYSTLAGTNLISLDNAAGNYSFYQFRKGGATRWNFGTHINGESGVGTESAGSDLRIWRYRNDGGYLSVPFHITRETGYVGINEGSPDYQLHVSGSDTGMMMVESSNANNTYIGIKNTSTDGTEWTISSTASTNSIGGGKMNFYNVENSLSLLTLDATTTRFGINNTSPDHQLHVTGVSGLSTVARFEQGITNNVNISLASTITDGRDWLIASTGTGNSSGSGKFLIYDNTGASNRFTIDGNNEWVGINTATPNTNIVGTFEYGSSVGGMHVYSSLSNARLIVDGLNSGGIDFIDRQATTNYHWLQLVYQDQLFKIRSIDDAGGLNADIVVVDPVNERVGINNAAPAYALDVAATGTNTTVAYFNSSGNNNANILLSSGNTGGLTWVFASTANTHPDGGGLLKIKVSGTGDNILNLDGVNNRVGIMNAAPAYVLDVEGTTIKATTDILIGEEAYSVNTSFVGIKPVNWTANTEYGIIFNKSAAGSTIISSAIGGSVWLRAGGHSATNRVQLNDTSGFTFDGNVTLNTISTTPTALVGHASGTLGNLNVGTGLIINGSDLEVDKANALTWPAENTVLVSNGTDDFKPAAGTLEWDGEALTVLSATGATASNVLIGSIQGGSIDAAAYNNTGIGGGALDALSTGFQNVALGTNAAGALSTGNHNTIAGSAAGFRITTGSYNSIYGRAANYGTSGTSAAVSYVSVFGGYAANINEANNISAFGYYSMVSNTSGTGNSGFGFRALRYNQTGAANSAFGHEAANGTSLQSHTGVSAFGYRALYTAYGDTNSGFGYYVGPNLTSGEDNTFLGSYAGAGITTGSRNTIVQPHNGIGTGIITGNDNTIIGYVTGLTDQSNAIVLADGEGNVRQQWNHTDLTWTLTANITLLSDAAPELQFIDDTFKIRTLGTHLDYISGSLHRFYGNGVQITAGGFLRLQNASNDSLITLKNTGATGLSKLSFEVPDGTEVGSYDESTTTWDFASTGTFNYNNSIFNVEGIKIEDRNIYSNNGGGDVVISGGTAASLGANIRLFGQASATNAGDIMFRNGGTVTAQYDASATMWDFKGNDLVIGEGTESNRYLYMNVASGANAWIEWQTAGFQRFYMGITDNTTWELRSSSDLIMSANRDDWSVSIPNGHLLVGSNIADTSDMTDDSLIGLGGGIIYSSKGQGFSVTGNLYYDSVTGWTHHTATAQKGGIFQIANAGFNFYHTTTSLTDGNAANIGNVLRLERASSTQWTWVTGGSTVHFDDIIYHNGGNRVVSQGNTVTLTNGVTGSAAFDSSGNVTINASVSGAGVGTLQTVTDNGKTTTNYIETTSSVYGEHYRLQRGSNGGYYLTVTSGTGGVGDGLLVANNANTGWIIRTRDTGGITHDIRFNRDGWVGIGDVTPTYPLDVYRSGSAHVANFNSGQASTYVRIQAGGTTAGYFYGESDGEVGILDNAGAWAVRVGSGGNLVSIQDSGTAYIGFERRSSRARLIVGSNDAATLWDSADRALLLIDGHATTGSTSMLGFSQGGSGRGYFLADSTFRMIAVGTRDIILTSETAGTSDGIRVHGDTGNVSIGGTTSSYTLDVTGDFRATTNGYFNSGVVGRNTTNYISIESATGFRFYDNSQGSVKIFDNGTNQGGMQFSASQGAVNMDARNYNDYSGTPSVSLHKYVRSSIDGGTLANADYQERWYTVTLAAYQDIGVCNDGGFFVKSTSTNLFRAMSAGDTKLRVDSTGILYVASNIIGYSTAVSDPKLKKNKESINAVDILRNTNGYKFQWVDNDVWDFGFMADETLPELTEYFSGGLEYHGASDYLAVRYEGYIPILAEGWKAHDFRLTELETNEQRQDREIQELRKENEELKRRIDELSAIR